MKVLIIGSGGREHALAWKLAQSDLVRHIYVAPGNAGTHWPAHNGFCRTENVPIQPSDLMGLRHFALEKRIDLTVVGPEAPLAEGVVDLFERDGLPIFGPTHQAAQLEASKAFAKAFMVEQHIPTAAYATFTDYHEAMAYLATLEAPEGLVVKASGLAAGKGVIICDDVAVAQEAVHAIMQDRAFGTAGDAVLIEERLSGPELSLLAFCDGQTAVPLLPARDHKRIFDHDQGPNTGGMGAFAPVPNVDMALIETVRAQVLQPTVDGMLRRGTPFKGILYAGIMLTPHGLRVLEFNCRFGDPETQVLLPLLENDLATVLMACIDGHLDRHPIHMQQAACATVVMASPGYPGHYPVGLPIVGIEEANRLANVMVFHAGTAENNGHVVTHGGRVLTVSGVGEDLSAALDAAYAGVQQISFEGAHYRTDIGGR